MLTDPDAIQPMTAYREERALFRAQAEMQQRQRRARWRLWAARHVAGRRAAVTRG